MFSISVLRGHSTPEGTCGKLTTSAGFSCDTLELEWQNNKSGVSCILPDTYNASIWFSPHLDRNVIRLEDKHGRADCLVHNGNFAGEAEGEITQIHGCTEVGHDYGQIEKPLGGTQFGILASGNTLNMLIEHVISQVGENGKFTVSYAWDDGYAPDDMADLNGQ